jgi:hypothetical protein
MGQQRKSWWGRNWLWFLPVICLTTLVMVAALLGVLFLGYLGITSTLRSSDAYVQAMAAARKDPRVVAALGTPIQAGTFLSGNISVRHDWNGGTSASSGKTDMVIPIYGPKGTARIYLIAAMSGGKWTFSKLVVRTADGKEFDLNKQAQPGKATSISGGRDSFWRAGIAANADSVSG